MLINSEASIITTVLHPTLIKNEGVRFTQNQRLAVAGVRAFQRARARSYTSRGLIHPNVLPDWQFALPHDRFSYHLMLSTTTGRFCAGVQVRLFPKSLSVLVERLHHFYQVEDYVSEEMIAALQACEFYQKEPVVSEVGGWLALETRSGFNASSIPCLAWAFNRVLDIRFSYAIARVDNGAADFLERMGAWRIYDKDYASNYYQGRVRLLGFKAFDVVRKYESRIARMEEIIRKKALLFCGSQPLAELAPDKWMESAPVPLMFPQGSLAVAAS